MVYDFSTIQDVDMPRPDFNNTYHVIPPRSQGGRHMAHILSQTVAGYDWMEQRRRRSERAMIEQPQHQVKELRPWQKCLTYLLEFDQ